MALLVGTTSTNHAEQILILKTQATRADAQQIAAEKAVSCFAEQIKGHPTTENLGKLQQLITNAQEATVHAADLREKINKLEIAYYNPLNCVEQNASLENRQVTQLDLDEPLGYFPTQAYNTHYESGTF